MDVEYTRNIISTWFGVNDVGQRHFADKAMRSFDRTPALLHTTFSDIRPVEIQGMVVGAFTTDVERIRVVMSACLTALHFRETSEKIPSWEVVLPNMGFGNDATHEEAGGWRQFLSLFSRMPFHARETNSPDVFQYAVADIAGGWVYSMRFYKSFLVFGFRAAEVDGKDLGG
jgi:hypothetical protein